MAGDKEIKRIDRVAFIQDLVCKLTAYNAITVLTTMSAPEIKVRRPCTINTYVAHTYRNVSTWTPEQWVALLTLVESMGGAAAFRDALKNDTPSKPAAKPADSTQTQANGKAQMSASDWNHTTAATLGSAGIGVAAVLSFATADGYYGVATEVGVGAQDLGASASVGALGFNNWEELVKANKYSMQTMDPVLVVEFFEDDNMVGWFGGPTLGLEIGLTYGHWKWTTGPSLVAQVGDITKTVQDAIGDAFDSIGGWLS